MAVAQDKIIMLDSPFYNSTEQVKITLNYANFSNTLLEVTGPSRQYIIYPSQTESFFFPSEYGQHTIKFIASGIVLDTAYLDIGPRQKTFRIFDSTNTTKSALLEIYDLSGNPVINTSSLDSLDVPYGQYDVEANLGRVNIKFRKLKTADKLSFGFEEISPKEIKGLPDVVAAYAIDPTQIEFEDAVVSSVAMGDSLYKCKDYDFIQRICRGSFVKVMDLKIGQAYSFILTREDPLYTELTTSTTGCSCSNTCTLPNAPNSQCTASCNQFCVVNFTVPTGAVSGWLQRVHYNVTITITTTDTRISGSHTGSLDKDTTAANGNEVQIGTSPTTTTLTTVFTNNAMPSSGSAYFDNTSCTTWANGYCTWRPYVTSSFTCQGRKNTCTTAITVTYINYTWNYTRSNPYLTIYSPENNTRQINPVIFSYRVIDFGTLLNCTLGVNNVVVNLTTNPLNNTLLNFTRYLSSTTNLWQINCTANSSDGEIRKVSSGIYNVTLNSAPSITNIIVENPINLLGGMTKRVYCNGTASDPDGNTDISKVNATLFMTGYSGMEDNQSNHYTNTSCALFNRAGNTADFNCSFDLQYFTNNGTWYCNATVNDISNATNSSLFSTYVNQLLAIGITPSVADFGVLQALQTSPDVDINITNYGNVPLDAYVSAYASALNDNLSMSCTSGTIAYEYERFSLLSGLAFLSMTPINNTLNAQFLDLSIPKQKGGGSIEKKPVYWKLNIPMGRSGKCNGKLLFSALIG